MYKINIVLLVSLSAVFCDVTFYSSYTGQPLTSSDFQKYSATPTTYFYCVNPIDTCTETEGRRIDGSCNNIKNPAAGAGHSTFDRDLPKVFTAKTDGTFGVRKATNGSDLPGPRLLRTKILADGTVPGHVFSQLMSLFFVFTATDIAAMSIHDTLNYVTTRPYCCQDKGATDPVCAPIAVPADDPVHRFSGLRCMNMTWPISHQSQGCAAANTSPERMNYGTPFFDLSAMYGNDPTTIKRQRKFTGGLLNFNVTSSGRDWPVVNATQSPTNATLDGISGLTGVNFIFGLFTWREHNRLARELAKINPCWTDEQLFNTARDINIATFAQIVYYELFALLFGELNLEEYGILTDDLSDFRDIYDPNQAPGMALEALFALRWIHVLQGGTLSLYNAQGEIVGSIPEVNLTLSTAALLTQSTNIQYVAQGAIRTSTGKTDNIVDPIVGNWGLGRLQLSTDLTSSDLAKNRLFGLAPYADYVESCFKVKITNFSDLSKYMSTDNIEILASLYNNVRDIDLIAGLWSEDIIEDGQVPHTFDCLLKKQLLRTVVSDRHWFERDTRPNAFTLEQLTEVRKASVARLMCDNADSIVQIQPRAFEIVSLDNPWTDCTKIPALDLKKWAAKC